MTELLRRRATRRWLLGLAVCSLAIAVLVSVGFHARRVSRQFACMNNLKNIVTAFKVYSAGLPGAPFASSVEAIQAMVDAGLVDAEQTVSPFTGLQFVLAYPGGFPGPTSGIDNGAAVAYEPVSEGDTGGGCVVFADGHGECMSAERHEATVARRPDDG